MKLGRLILVLLLSSFIFNNAIAAGDAAKGKILAASCAACHSADGNSMNPEWPKIAGLNQKYFIEQMLAFQQGAKGPRNNAIMLGISSGLSKQDIEDLAAFFALQKMTPGSTPKNYVELGQAIYRGGIIAKGIPACAACHGPQGNGNNEAGFPELSGQYAKYVEHELKAYKDGARTTGENQIMPTIAKKMSEAEIIAVANYVAGLH